MSALIVNRLFASRDAVVVGLDNLRELHGVAVEFLRLSLATSFSYMAPPCDFAVRVPLVTVNVLFVAA